MRGSRPDHTLTARHLILLLKLTHHIPPWRADLPMRPVDYFRFRRCRVAVRQGGWVAVCVGFGGGGGGREGRVGLHGFGRFLGRDHFGG